MNGHTPAPVLPGDRIDTLDVLRGVAICGILLMNIPMMGMIGERGSPPVPGGWTPDWIAWVLQHLFFEGTMRGLFTMLFGAGMLLMLRRAEGENAQVAPIDVWTRRSLALMVLGIVQWAVFMWPGEILFNYGMTGLFLLAFRTARPRTLLALGGAILLILSVQWGFEARGSSTTLKTSDAALAAKAAGRTLTKDQEAAVEAREEMRKTFHPTPKEVSDEYRDRTHLGSLVGWSAGIWTKWNIGDWVAGLMESIAFMLIGMGLYRTGILTGAAPPVAYRTLMIVGYGGGLAWRGVLLWLRSRTGFEPVIALIDPNISAFQSFSYEPARLLMTLGHVGLLATLWRSGALGRAVPLRALGRTALTVYSLQSILTSILFYALGWVGAFGFLALMGIAAIIWVVTCLFSLWWLRTHDMGPAEQFLRAVAYGTFRGRRRAEAKAALASAPPV